MLQLVPLFFLLDVQYLLSGQPFARVRFFFLEGTDFHTVENVRKNFFFCLFFLRVHID